MFSDERHARDVDELRQRDREQELTERRRLHDALLKFGQHLPGCEWFAKDELGCGAKPCTCGLDEALGEQSSRADY